MGAKIANACMQVLHPQVLTLLVMIGGCAVCLALQLGGNTVAFITLASQVVIGLTNATIVGGVFAMAAWLPQKYVQASLPPPTTHMNYSSPICKNQEMS